MGIPSSVKVQASVLPVPQSGTEFERDWKSIRKQPEEVFQYLKAIPPSSMAHLFKQDLVADIFSSILETLQNFYFPELAQEAFDVLTALSSVHASLWRSCFWKRSSSNASNPSSPSSAAPCKILHLG